MKISTINTIELSSVCDNRCEYCPAKDQHEWRETGFMTWDVYGQAIDWALHFARKGTQRELNLFGIGESTLHKDIIAMVAHARKTLPFQQVLHLNTNGNTMTKELARGLKDAGINQIDITYHNARAAARTRRIFIETGIKHAISIDPVLFPNNWAGQVDWFEYFGPPVPCPWIKHGQATVQSNGDVTVCCWDAKCQGKMGTVYDNITEFEIKPFNLCRTCHQVIAGGIYLH